MLWKTTQDCYYSRSSSKWHHAYTTEKNQNQYIPYSTENPKNKIAKVHLSFCILKQNNFGIKKKYLHMKED